MSIDGSTILLSLSDGALVREIASSGVAARKTRFAFLNDKQGTVSDGKDAAKVIGLFRATDSRLEIDYADGHSESLMPNASGGVSILLGAPGQGPLCMSWYPEGHQFSAADRQLALALYASRLGLPSPLPAKMAAPVANCATAAAQTDAHEKAAASKPVRAPGRHAQRVRRTGAVKAGGAVPKALPSGTIVVRSSQVHAVDRDSATAGRVRAATAGKVQTASLTGNDTGAATPTQRASTCLSIESDGISWGFHNHCSFAVQYAYCLMDGGDAAASCQKGAVMGGVPANGFNRLLAERATNAGQHDFRWIACNGSAGEIVPRLIKADPPAGQCAPGRAS